MRILAFSPIGPRGIHPKVLESLVAQRGAGFHDILFSQDNPYNYPLASVYRNIQLNYEKMRQYALQGGYSKVWIVEDDTIPPCDALARLLSVDAPVVSGVYAMRHGEPCPNIFKKHLGSVAVGNQYKWREVPFDEVVEVSGGCMGCLLLDRSVLERFNFHLDADKWAPDGPFMQWCFRNGIKQMAHCGVLCGHAKPDGTILWPDKETGWRVE